MEQVSRFSYAYNLCLSDMSFVLGYKKMGNKENIKKGIVLNRMYSGSYLTTNLGHEVINMFQSDNGKHYLYLNAKGNYDHKGLNVKNMLLVRNIGNYSMEVVGLAKDLIPIESAKCVLPRDLTKTDKKIQEKQIAFIKEENIKYNHVFLHHLFNDLEQQSIYVTYYVEDGHFFKPKKRFIIYFREPMTKDNDNIIAVLKDYNFSNQSLRQFILEGQDLDTLESIVDDSHNWIKSNEKICIDDNYQPFTPSLIDICQIQNDENCFSNALSYFLMKYTNFWCDLLGINGEFTISREHDAKVNDCNFEKTTGGRIDLLLCSNDAYIIIENKIKSDIIIQDDISQIDRYWNYVEYLNDKNDKKKVVKGFVLAPNYNLPNLLNSNYQLLTYSDVCKYLDKRMNIVKRDAEFYAFYKAMKRHSYITENQSLYEDMKNTFFARIINHKHEKF